MVEMRETTLPVPPALALGAWILAAVCIGACASGADDADSGTSRRDAGPPMDGGRVDGARPSGDGGHDAGPPDRCGGVVCMGFEYCFDGTCRPYPGCTGAAGCTSAMDVCRGEHCVPRDRDIDGDGTPAGMDCDETSPLVYPGAMERCNARDDNCDGTVDEGDPGTLCRDDPSGGICIMGVCGCPSGRFDLDREPANGCECVADPPPGRAETCMMAQDLGMVDDSGQTVMATGNVLPDDREAWYHFRAVDSPDTACDNFHVDVRFMTNPAMAFELSVFRGSCDMAECMGMHVQEYSWATDFHTPGAGMANAGECPCWGGTAPAVDGLANCADNSSDFWVRVTRKAGAMVTCTGFALAVTNGVYDTM